MCGGERCLIFIYLPHATGLFKMQMSKISDDDKVKICKKYFKIGLFLLPFVWLVNVVWFFKPAFITKPTHPVIRRYVLASLLGVVLWTVGVITWTVIYQTQRVNWGVGGDYISVVVPYGRA